MRRNVAAIDAGVSSPAKSERKRASLAIVENRALAKSVGKTRFRI